MTFEIFAENNIIVVDELNFEAPKTKEMIKVLNALNVEGKALVVTGDVNENVALSARNIPGVLPLEANGVNVYDALNAGKIILTKDAVAKIEEVLA